MISASCVAIVWAAVGLPAPPTLLIATPIGHITGYLWGLEAPFRIGARVVLLDRWDAAEAVRLIHDGDTVATGGFVGIGFAVPIESAASAAGLPPF